MTKDTRKRTRRLSDSDAYVRAIVSSTIEGVITIDERGVIESFNPAAEKIFGLSRNEAVGQPANCLMPEREGEAHDSYLARLVQGGSPRVLGVEREVQGRRKDGTIFPMYLAINEMTVGGARKFVGIVHDISKRKCAEEALYEEKERALVTLHSIGDAVITTDAAGNIDYLNPAAEKLTGWRLPDAQGRAIESIFLLLHEGTREKFGNPLTKCLRERAKVDTPGYALLVARDGREIAVENTASPILNRRGDPVGAVLVCHDVSLSRQLAHQMRYQASHDSLTGLVNRGEFERRLEALLAKAAVEDAVHALCFMDLDQFKVVNDVCGHVAGDELLKQLTLVLQEKVRDSDTLARIGGDEFALLLENCPIDQAELIAEIIRQAVTDFRFVWHEKTFVIGVSIGIAPINSSSVDLASVLGAADLACYAAKERGRNRVWVYHPENGEPVRHSGESQWAYRINRAFAAGGFRLYCQAITPLGFLGDKRTHYEILLRMVDEDGSIVPPMAFIPAAERYNLMPAIDRWVIRTVFSRLAERRRDKRPLNAGNFGINLSAASLGDKHLLAFIRERLLEHETVPPHMICFEITESLAITHLNDAVRLIRELKKLGFMVCLDDFGRGLTSFAYLKNLPVDYLKLDGSFIKDLEFDRIDAAMVEAINNVGHVMGIQTVAQSVESGPVLEKLKQIGVDYAQGYRVSDPLPWDEALALTRPGRSRPRRK